MRATRSASPASHGPVVKHNHSTIIDFILGKALQSLSLLTKTVQFKQLFRTRFVKQIMPEASTDAGWFANCKNLNVVTSLYGPRY